jgi:uncharacterized membrane protein YesL
MNIGGFLSNDSKFGKMMTKVGTLIVLNILFAVSCVPFVTIGPALSALFYSLREVLKEEENDRVNFSGGAINPVKVYIKGIRRNFFRSVIIWLLFVGVMMMGSVNLQICAAWAGPMKYTSSIVAAVMFTVFAVFVSVFPVLACTEGGIKDIIKMAFETILLSPLRTAGSMAVYAIPLILIRFDTVNEPLYAFIFCFFGCAVLGMTVTKLLMKPIDRVLTLHKALEA